MNIDPTGIGIEIIKGIPNVVSFMKLWKMWLTV